MYICQHRLIYVYYRYHYICVHLLYIALHAYMFIVCDVTYLCVLYVVLSMMNIYILTCVHVFSGPCAYMYRMHTCICCAPCTRGSGLPVRVPHFCESVTEP